MCSPDGYQWREEGGSGASQTDSSHEVSRALYQSANQPHSFARIHMHVQDLQITARNFVVAIGVTDMSFKSLFVLHRIPTPPSCQAVTS